MVGPVAADPAAAGGADDDNHDNDGNESEILQQEFKGYQLKHHLTAEELEQQRSQ